MRWSHQKRLARSRGRVRPAPPPLPARLRDHLIGLLGREVETWLADLPRLVEFYAEMWDLTLTEFLDDGWSAYVAGGIRAGGEVVVKVSPDRSRAQAEIAGLLIRAGIGVPRVLEHDFEDCIVLMERVHRAGELALRAPERDAAMAGLANVIHVEPPPEAEHVPPLIDFIEEWWAWLEKLNPSLSRPIDAALMHSGIEEARLLAETTIEPRLLHGDFNARNVVSGIDGPIAIDAPAMIGDREFDLANWLVSEGPDDPGIRVERMARLTGTDPERIWRWAWPLLIDLELERRRVDSDEGPMTDIAGFSNEALPHLATGVELQTARLTSSGATVAIVIPVLNGVTTVRDTLGSLTRQSFRAWRAIVVDDGSTDGTGDVVAEYARTDPRISLLRNAENLGVSAARNKALAAVDEPWICFLDADDWLADTALERLAGRAAEGGCDAVHGGTVRVADDGTCIPVARATSSGNLFPLFARAPAVPIHSCLVRAAAVREAGGFDESLVTCEDWDLWQRVSRAGARWAAVPDVVAFYRMRSDSASQQAPRMLTDGLTVIESGHRGEAGASAVPSERERLLARTYLACSAAGMAIADQDDAPEGLLTLLGDEISREVDADVATRVVFEAVAVARAASIREWPAFPDRVRVATLRFLAALGSCATKPRFLHHSEAALDRLVLTQRPRPSVSGRWQTTELRPGCPCEALTSDEGVDRVICVVQDGEDLVGTAECVPADGRLPAFVIADAVAGEFGWELLTRFLQVALAAEVEIELDAGVARVHRCGQLLHQGPVDETSPPLAAVMEHVGWTLFMQELWGRPDWPLERFYDPDADSAAPSGELVVAADVSVVEVGAELPDIVAARPVTVGIRVGGTPFCVVQIAPVRGRVSAQRLRCAINLRAGFELCRVVAREVLLLGSDVGTSLRERLRASACEHSRAGEGAPASDRGLVPGWQRCAAAAAAGAGGLALVGVPADAAPGTASSRAAVLPASARDVIIAAARRSGGVIVGVGDDSGSILRAPFVIPSSTRSRPSSVLTKDGAMNSTLARLPGSFAKRLRAATRRTPDSRSDDSSEIPTELLRILVYHDAAEAAEHVRMLSHNGYRAVSLEQWASAAIARVPLAGRAVALVYVITPHAFEREVAAALHAGAGTATLLVASNLGERDRRETDVLRRLAHEGISIGCIGDSDLGDLSPDLLTRTLVSQQDELHRIVGVAPATIGFLNGVTDAGVAQIAGACGFIHGIVDGCYPASFADSLLRLPATPAPSTAEALVELLVA
jgi:glycosyltransferase involved in cell wall biosynthesis/streptomycin 6-kinase